MTNSLFRDETFDDLMRSVIEEVQKSGYRIHPSKGACMELAGVLLELTNPRARLSRTETRGKPFSCLGELCWYLAKTNDLDFIHYYAPAYKHSSEDGEVYGGYGPRLFDWRGVHQWDNIAGILRCRPSSRRAVIQLFDSHDIVKEHKDVPCTCTLQFMIRDKKLHLIASMRSNDVILGLPHDVFAFTMLQEIMARSLAVELGPYKHFVGSLHLYDKNKQEAQQFMDEGWQSTQMSMPPMPIGDPWPSIRLLLKAESALRAGAKIHVNEINTLDPYWLDFVRLLHILRLHKNREIDKIKEIRKEMSSPIYHTFIDKRLVK